MCGQYWIGDDGIDEKMRALAAEMERQFPGEYKTGEIRPGDTAPAIIARDDRILPRPAVFGFPGFHGSRLIINARAETAAEKKTFAESLRERRIILPASGFFEWSRDERKVKYLFTMDRRPTLYLCGLYTLIDGVYRFVILTRAANASMLETHDRMPVIAAENEVRPYLTDHSAALRILDGPAPELTRKQA